MNTTSFRWILLLCAANAAWAQRNDLGFLFGFSQRNASLRNDVIRGEVRLSFQFTPALLLHETKPGRLYAELPILTAAGLNGKIDHTVTGRIAGVAFVTPGLRYHVNVSPRFGLYLVGGVGFAGARERLGVPTGSLVVTTKNTYWSPAANYGGGFDFRLSDRWSLRADVRDFRARRSTRVPGRNTGVTVGFALRF